MTRFGSLESENAGPYKSIPVSNIFLKKSLILNMDKVGSALSSKMLDYCICHFWNIPSNWI